MPLSLSSLRQGSWFECKEPISPHLQAGSGAAAKRSVRLPIRIGILDDGTRLNESGNGFRIVGVFQDVQSASIAVEFAVTGMLALTNSPSGVKRRLGVISGAKPPPSLVRPVTQTSTPDEIGFRA
jgi:hypothetical protein